MKKVGSIYSHSRSKEHEITTNESNMTKRTQKDWTFEFESFSSEGDWKNTLKRDISLRSAFDSLDCPQQNNNLDVGRLTSVSCILEQLRVLRLCDVKGKTKKCIQKAEDQFLLLERKLLNYDVL